MKTKTFKLGTALKKKLSLVQSRLYRYRDVLLTDVVVSIDPSCVSRGTGSKPGYAIFEQGEFVEQGILDVPYHTDLAFRLQGIRELIQRDIDPNVAAMIIEDTPVKPIRTRAEAGATGRSFMNMKTIASQKQAIGATKAALTRGKPVIEIPAALWQTWIKDKLGLEIDKADDNDARLIGLAAFAILREQQKRSE